MCRELCDQDIPYEGYNPLPDKVLIDKSEYEELIKDRDWLRCLEAAGVDNWSGFDYAIEIKENNEVNNEKKNY